MEYLNWIEIRVDKRFGKPCLKGTRITVYDVLSWLSNGQGVQDIMNDFPEITKEMILACLSYASDKEHKLRIAS